MSEFTIKEHNAETNEISERPMTKQEIAEYQAILDQTAKKKLEIEAKEAARQTILDKLGLTADEVAALGL